MTNHKRNRSNNKCSSILALCWALCVASSSVAQTESSSTQGLNGAQGVQSRAPVLELQSTIVGNQEQPEVIYIIPWKQIDAPAPSYQPMQSMLDGQFEPIDRDEWRRNIDLRQAVDSDPQANF